jgi:hypothetical protein
LILAVLLESPPARAAGGRLTGTVLGTDGGPLESVSVRLEGTPLGALTDREGRFTIANIPPGNYRVVALHFGFHPGQKEGVEVGSERTVTLELRLRMKVVASVTEVGVTADKWAPIRPKDSDTRHNIRPDDIKNKPVISVEEAASHKPGMTMQAGQLHVRGSRPTETKVYVGDMLIPAPLGGAYRPATNGVAGVEVVTGAFDAQYGDTGGGMIMVTTPEGGDRFSGDLEFMTDDFGAPDKTYDNFDRLGVAFGGPTGVNNLTYFMSFQGTFEDGFLKTVEERPKHTILDFIKVGPRQSNDLSSQGKLAWRVDANRKLTFEVLKTHRASDIYSHLFSRSGYVQARFDTIAADGRIVTRYGRFSAVQEDSTFVPYNAASHTPDVKDDFDHSKLVWNHTLTPSTFYSLKLSRTRFAFDMRVRDQHPWEYNGDNFDQWQNRIDLSTNRFFATNGDFPRFTNRKTETWTLQNDWTHELADHRLKAGLVGRYNDLSLLAIDFPLSVSPEGEFGGFRSQYHYYNPEGAFYLQDRWEHEGMILNAGLRYDIFSVGSQLDVSEVDSRTRKQLSPRFGIAYPITDRDVFSFHYGRYSQVPDRASIFENRTAGARVRGNPNLVNETTVAYQAAVQHMFGRDVFGQVAVYFKDIFGLLSTEQRPLGNSPGLVTTWVNRDYASARGFELSLEKRFSHYFGGELSYTYASATGVASDPNQQVNTNFLFLPISEQPLNWDQRHTFNAQVVFQNPDEWLLSGIWTYGSGFPFTPASRNERRFDPTLTNTGRLPSITSLNLQMEKHYNIWNQDVKFFFRGNNILDAKNLNDLEPDNWPDPPGTNNNDYRAFYTETGRAGGAYLGDDVNQDGVEDWIPVNDPRVFQEGRSLKMGFGMKF